MLRASFGSHRRHRECWQSNFPSRVEGPVIYLFASNKNNTGLDRQSVWFVQPYVSSALFAGGKDQRGDDPNPLLSAGIPRSSFRWSHQKPPWRTHLWVKMSPPCPPATAGREGTALPPLKEQGRSFLLLSTSWGLQGSYDEHVALIFSDLVLPNQLTQPAEEMKVGLAGRRRGTAFYFLIQFGIWIRIMISVSG